MKTIIPLKKHMTKIISACFIFTVLSTALSTVLSAQALEPAPLNGQKSPRIHPDLVVPAPTNSAETLQFIQKALQEATAVEMKNEVARVPDYQQVYRLFQTAASVAVSEYLKTMAVIHQEISVYYSRLEELQKQARTEKAFLKAFEVEKIRIVTVQQKLNQLYQEALKKLIFAKGYGIQYTAYNPNVCSPIQDQTAKRNCNADPLLYQFTNYGLGAATYCKTIVCAAKISEDQKAWFAFARRLNRDIQISGIHLQQQSQDQHDQNDVKSFGSFVQAAVLSGIQQELNSPDSKQNNLVLGLVGERSRDGQISAASLIEILESSEKRWQRFFTRHFVHSNQLTLTLSSLAPIPTGVYLAMTQERALDRQIQNFNLAAAEWEANESESSRKALITQIDALISSLLPASNSSSQSNKNETVISTLVRKGTLTSTYYLVIKVGTNMGAPLYKNDQKTRLDFCKKEGFDHVINELSDDNGSVTCSVPYANYISTIAGSTSTANYSTRVIVFNNISVQNPFKQEGTTAQLNAGTSKQILNSFCQSKGYLDEASHKEFSNGFYTILFTVNAGVIAATPMTGNYISEIQCSY